MLLSAEQIGKIWAESKTTSGAVATALTKFNPTIEEFAGEFNLPTNPLYHLSNLAYNYQKEPQQAQQKGSL